MLDLLIVVVAVHALLAHLGALFATILALQRRGVGTSASTVPMPLAPTMAHAPEIEAMRMALLGLQHENANLHGRIDRVLDHLCLRGGALGTPVDHATPVNGMEAAEAPPAATQSVGAATAETPIATAPTTPQDPPHTILTSYDHFSEGPRGAFDPVVERQAPHDVLLVLHAQGAEPHLHAEGEQLVEQQVGGVVLAQVIPDVLDGVELGAVGRQVVQVDALGHAQLAAPVPPRAVDEHHEVFAREGASDRPQVGAHLRAVAALRVGEHQAPVAGAHRRPRRQVVARELLAHHRADGGRRPAGPHRGDQTEAALVLEEDADAAAAGPRDLAREDAAELFL